MKKGFSLIELLVVISIMAILVTVSVVSYSNVRRSSRDSRRLADLENLRQALVMYRSDMGCYPPQLANLVDEGYWTGAIPTDPKSDTDYSYVPKTDADYCTVVDGKVSFTLSATNFERGVLDDYTVSSP